MGRLMHNGKPWTEEGHPPDSPERLAVLGVDESTPTCNCQDRAEPWTKEGHAPDCPAAPQAEPGRSVVGAEGDSVPCTCSPKWKGEGHERECARRLAVLGVDEYTPVCNCRDLKYDGEGHHPECASRGSADGAPVARKKGKRKR